MSDGVRRASAAVVRRTSGMRFGLAAAHVHLSSGASASLSLSPSRTVIRRPMPVVTARCFAPRPVSAGPKADAIDYVPRDSRGGSTLTAIRRKRHGSRSGGGRSGVVRRCDETEPHQDSPRDVPRPGSWTRAATSGDRASGRLEKPEARRAGASLRLRPAIFIPIKQPESSSLEHARIVVGRRVMEDRSIHWVWRRGSLLSRRRLLTRSPRGERRSGIQEVEVLDSSTTQIGNTPRRGLHDRAATDASGDRAPVRSRRHIMDEAAIGPTSPASGMDRSRHVKGVIYVKEESVYRVAGSPVRIGRAGRRNQVAPLALCAVPQEITTIPVVMDIGYWIEIVNQDAFIKLKQVTIHTYEGCTDLQVRTNTEHSAELLDRVDRRHSAAPTRATSTARTSIAPGGHANVCAKLTDANLAGRPGGTKDVKVAVVTIRVVPRSLYELPPDSERGPRGNLHRRVSSQPRQESPTRGGWPPSTPRSLDPTRGLCARIMCSLRAWTADRPGVRSSVVDATLRRANDSS